MNADKREIRCMLIPLHGERLLLPNAAVVEIIGYREPDSIDWQAPWLQGTVKWHQRPVPVIDFENLAGDTGMRASIRQRIVVCYSPKFDNGWPLIGLLSQGIPRLVRVSAEAIEDATEGPHGDSDIEMRIRLGGDSFVVPDMRRLAERLPDA